MAVGSNRPLTAVSVKRKAISERDAAYEKALQEIAEERAAEYNAAQTVRNERLMQSRQDLDYFEARKEDALRKALAAQKAGDRANFRVLVKDAETYESAWITATKQHAKLEAALEAQSDAERRQMRRGLEAAAEKRMAETFEKEGSISPLTQRSESSAVSVLKVPRAFQKPNGEPLFPIKRAEIQRIVVSGTERTDAEGDAPALQMQGRAPVAGVRLRDPEDFPKLLRYIQTERNEEGLAFAWTIVVTTVWRSLVKAAMRLVKNESDANTLAGATVAMAYETIGAFDVDREEKRKSKNMEEAFTGWLIHAAKNDFIDEIRKMGKFESDQRFTRDDESDGEFTSVYEQVSSEDQGSTGLRFDVRPSFGSLLQAESADLVSDLKRALKRLSTELVSGREKVQAFKMYAFYDYKQKQIGAEFPTYTPQGELKPLTERSVNAWIQEVFAALQQKSPEFEHLCREGAALVESAKAHEDVWKTDRMDAVEERKAIRRGESPRAENPWMPLTLSDRDFLLVKGFKNDPGDSGLSVVAVFRTPFEGGTSGPSYMAATLRSDASPYHPISWRWMPDKEFRQWQSNVVRLDELTAAQKHHYKEWKEHCMRKVGATVHYDGTPLRRENPRRLRNPSFRHLPAALSGLLKKLTR